MGKSSKQYDQLLSTLNSYLQQNFAASQQAAATESPYLHQLGVDATDFLNQVKSGDLRNVKLGSYFNMDSLANQQKMRGMLSDSHATGQAALGGQGNATLLALDKQNRNDEFQHDYANEFQNAIQQGVGSANQTLAALGEAEQSRRTGSASNSAGLFGTAFSALSNKPKSPWSSILSGAMGALPSIISAI